MLVPVPKTPLGLQRLITALSTQRYTESKSLIFRHVRSIVAESPDSTPWSLDGEYAPGRERVEISIDHNALELMI
jgi:diacylglycerol kinase family enzyme